MSKLIIMVASFAPQAGKSSFTSAVAAKYLPLNKGYVSVYSFANPVKWMLISLLQQSFGYSEEDAVLAVFGKAKEESLKLHGEIKPITHRKMLQTLGTEWRLALGYETMWSDILASGVKNTPEGNLNLIDDWRYIAEYDVIKQLEAQGFKVITVCIRNTTAEANYTGSHSSEGELKDFAFDHVVTNDGSMSDFITKVHQFAASLGAE